MIKYHSGYFVTLRGGKFSPDEYSEERIKVTKFKLTSSNYRGNGWEVEWIYSDYWGGLEFIINAPSFEIAQNVLFNVLCSIAVINGTAVWSNEVHYPHVLGTIDKVKGFDIINKPINGFNDPSIPEYFYLASLASKDENLANSIVKYQLSTEIYSKDYMDLHELIDWKTTDFSYIQMRFAYAIITAYSVIEELGLNVNVSVSKDRRSRLDNGEWNPEVLSDLENRLKLANVNLDEEISWMIRGNETQIEKNKPVRTTRLAEWADPQDYDEGLVFKIKDGYVYLPDAINYISFLRSSISSHSVGNRIMNLSVFDVANAQFLARRLIMEITGFWK